MRLARVVALHTVGVATQLPTDRSGVALKLLCDLAHGETQVLNLVAFVLAQVRVAQCAVPLGGEAAQATAPALLPGAGVMHF